MRMPDRHDQEPGESSPSGTLQLLSIEGPEDFEEDRVIAAVVAGGDRVAMRA